jgi:hypothetical protein
MEKVLSLRELVKKLCSELPDENIKDTIEMWKKEKIVIWTEEHSLYETSKSYWKKYYKNFVESEF